MRQSHTTTKLPRQIRDELDNRNDGNGASRFKRTGPSIRKERRKAARIQKKERQAKPRPLVSDKAVQYARENEASDFSEFSDGTVVQPASKEIVAKSMAPRSILKRSQVNVSSKLERGDQKSHSLVLKPQLSPGVKDRLAKDDAEIAALEKALGIKGKRKLPKSFEEEGLGELLNGLDDASTDDSSLNGKRKRSEEEWLDRKRQKAVNKARGYPKHADIDEEEVSFEDDGNAALELSSEGVISGEEDGLEVDSQEDSDDEVDPHIPPPKKIRENPYVAPGMSEETSSKAKYIPPSLRAVPSSTQDLHHLRRQIQGFLNRLSEANLVTILGDLEMLYRNHPRQHVTSTLVDLLIGLLCDPTSLQDTFIILHAGFIAAVYKTIGMEFGACAIQSLVERFNELYNANAKFSDRKKLTNLISLISELYNFMVLGSAIIYDLLRIFLRDLSETNTELLLKVVRNSGPQLRQDDPSTLKDIVLLLQSATDKVGHDTLSVRTKFMIETINNLKNNRMKTGVAASTIMGEHVTRMKKILGSLNSRNNSLTEPLRLNLKDIQETDKKGRWWLIGASYRDEREPQAGENALSTQPPDSILDSETNVDGGDHLDLQQLAREHRMNTDIRRSIFVAIMSATDFRDAHQRLLKLHLKKSQEVEIPQVLIHCAGAENVYNPFYTLISRQLCSDRRLKMAFQFAIWGLFKRMGENEGNNEVDMEDESEDSLETRSVINLAKLYGVLIGEGRLSPGILKILNLVYLKPKTHTFVEVLLITAILHSQQGSSNRRREKALVETFSRLQGTPDLVKGLQYFLKKVVSKTDIIASKDRETLIWGCWVAGNALRAIASPRDVE